MAKLTASGVANKREPGRYGDGDGLWLEVATSQRRAWFLRYMRNGKARTMGLGDADDVSLKQAREKAADARKLLGNGIDPIEHRRAAREVETAAQAKQTTFAEAAQQYIAGHEAGWRNPKHRQQWRNTLTTYAEPVLGNLPVGAVGTEQVLKVLNPIWSSRPETASRVRGRIEQVLSYSIARGWRDGPNPAVWRGHLQLMLPAKGKVRAVEHHAALDWREAPAFMVELRKRNSFGARSLEFLILTAVRSGEVRGATWDEFDLAGSTWTIPAARMKAARPHRVPLSEPALGILQAMAKLKDGSGLVFLGQKHGAQLSDMTLTAVLRRMGRNDLTAHGFRSTFRDWAAENTHHPNHVVELALAHAIGDKVEAAYRRGDLFEKRQALMADWALYLLGTSLHVADTKPPPLAA
jgi:integrase